jgi:Protein of unknown function (DUF2442)
MIYPKLVSVEPLLPTDLLLAYADGSTRRFSCSAYLDRGVFVRLKDPGLFSQAHVCRRNRVLAGRPGHRAGDPVPAFVAGEAAERHRKLTLDERF